MEAFLKRHGDINAISRPQLITNNHLDNYVHATWNLGDWGVLKQGQDETVTIFFRGQDSDI